MKREGGHKGRPYGEWLGVGTLSVGWRRGREGTLDDGHKGRPYSE